MANITTRHLGLAALLVLGTTAPGFAQDANGGFYGRVFGGVNLLSDTPLTGALAGTSGFDTGQIFGGAVGYEYAGLPLRAELEYAYRTADPDGALGITGDFASTTVALNGYYSFAPVGAGRLTPYVGAGLAYVTEVDFDITGGPGAGEYSDSGIFRYQLMVGAEYAITDRWSLNGELRYFDAGSQTLTNSTGGTLTADYDAVDVIFGATLRF